MKQPYGMPIAMMENLHPSASTYPDNVMAIVSPINPYITLGFVVNNPSRMAQPSRGL